MALFNIYDKLWIGSADSANLSNVRGHGITDILLFDGVKVEIGPGEGVRVFDTELTGARQPTDAELVRVTDDILARISKGGRVLLADKTGEGSSGAIAALYLNMFCFAWDEAWARVLSVNPRCAPLGLIFQAARAGARARYAVLR
jgi:hypothetical protein